MSKKETDFNKALKFHFHDPSFGFVSAKKFHKKIKEAGLNITMKEVIDFVKREYAQQVNKPRKRPPVFNSVIAPEPKADYQMDFMIYDRYAWNGYKYILVVIDVNSRFLSAKAMKTRKLEAVTKATEEIFDKIGWPKNLNTDNEFNKKEFTDAMEKHNVTMWFSQVGDVQKNSIVERVNKTIASLLQRYRTTTKKHDWVSVLPSIVSNYNNTEHSTTHQKPIDVFTGAKENEQTVIHVLPSLKVGDKVRVVKTKKLFDKGDVRTHSKAIYVIDSRDKNRFALRNASTGKKIKRRVKEYELSKVEGVNTEPEADTTEELLHKVAKKERKVNRKLKQEDIEPERVVRQPRARKPAQKVISNAEL